MTREQLDIVALSLVLARTQLKTMSAASIAFGYKDAAAMFMQQEAAFESLQLLIVNGTIKPTDKEH